MATISPQSVDLDGLLDPTWAPASAGGDVFPNNGKCLVRFRNTAGGANAITVTIASVRNCSYGFDHDVVAVVDFGEELTAGPFDKVRFNNTTGAVAITYSGVTTFDVQVLQLDEI